MRNKVGTPKRRTQRRNRRRSWWVAQATFLGDLRRRRPDRSAWLCAGNHTWRYENQNDSGQGHLRKLGLDRRACTVCHRTELGTIKHTKHGFTFKVAI